MIRKTRTRRTKRTGRKRREKQILHRRQSLMMMSIHQRERNLTIAYSFILQLRKGSLNTLFLII